MTPIESNDFLQSIQSGWLNSTKAQTIASYCGIEELETYGQIVVPRSSATSLCNRALDPFTANHIDIVKPQSRSDPRYSRFANALEREIPNLDSTATQGTAAATGGHGDAAIRNGGKVDPTRITKDSVASAGNQGTTNHAPVTQSNSGGCNQLSVGGNNNTNNCVPPPRMLTRDQQAALAAAIAQIPDGVQVKVGSADSAESQGYADQIRKALGIQRQVGTLFGWHPKGIYVGVNSRNDVAAVPAQLLASQMKQAGLNIVDVEEDPRHDHPGEIEVIVGEQ
jgi:hypothetical protein